jgi:twitching motility protein PilT
VAVSDDVEGKSGQSTPVATFGPFEVLGEIGLLLEQPSTTTILASGPVLALKLARSIFEELLKHNPPFVLNACRALARRLLSGGRLQPPERAAAAGLSQAVQAEAPPHPAVPAGSSQDSVVRPTSRLIASAPPAQARSFWLDRLLTNMIRESASDLHLSAGHRPWLRVHGEFRVLTHLPALGETEVLQIVDPVMAPRSRQKFREQNDTDFAYTLPGVARFRVNVFRDVRGIGAVFRLIPTRLPSFEQLGLPPTIRRFCDHPNGLVLVTGATGMGKSTTLAAMIHYINTTRSMHVVTLEDPIEYVHDSVRSLVNQREVGGHTRSFSRALRAALREDPDIILVGELRDLDTLSLALESANTGHLVFATLHTSSAPGAINRIVGMFPPDQQSQVCAMLADVLRGVVTQTLCRRVQGGRVVALEILVSNPAIANLIREYKVFQIPTIMSTGKASGNVLLSDDLARLVSEGTVEYDEAYTRASDKADFARRFDRQPGRR